MKRIITLVFVALLCGVDVNAQRPVGDTIAYGGGGEYWYDTAYTNGSCAYYRYMSYKIGLLDDAWTCYSLLLRMSEFQNSQTTSPEEFYHQYPDLASYCALRSWTTRSFLGSFQTAIGIFLRMEIGYMSWTPLWLDG